MFFSDLAADLQAGHLRHHTVQDDKVGPLCQRLIKGVLSVCGCDDVAVLLREDAQHDKEIDGFVIGDQYRRRCFVDVACRELDLNGIRPRRAAVRPRAVFRYRAAAEERDGNHKDRAPRKSRPDRYPAPVQFDKLFRDAESQANASRGRRLRGIL